MQWTLQDAQSVLVLKMYTLYTAEAWKKCLPVRKKYITLWKRASSSRTSTTLSRYSVMRTAE